MPILYLVRHGRAAAGWDRDVDPGLDAVGRAQARGLVPQLASVSGAELVASPMARARETAAPLAAAWQAELRIEPRVGEIPSPRQSLAARGAWLREIAPRTWPQLETSLQEWRRAVLAALGELDRDAVVVTHYIAINVAIGAATGDDRVVNFRPDHCSVTVLRCEGGRLEVVRRGVEAATAVL